MQTIPVQTVNIMLDSGTVAAVIVVASPELFVFIG